MRRLWALVFLAVAACEDLPPSRDMENSEVRKAFEGWVNLIVKGDAPAVYAGMSNGYKTQWLFDLLRTGDSVAHEWRRSLTGDSRTSVDLWYNFHKDKNAARVPALDPSIVGSPSVVGLWVRTFQESRAEAQRQMSQVRITEIYSDGAGATVVVRNVIGTSEMYEMVLEGVGWKINHHRETVRQVPK